MRVVDLFRFIQARHQIYINRFELGLPKPWTGDKILRDYRFCNVYRELDKETIWIRENWREPHDKDPNLWFAMVVARMFNWSPTLDAIRYPVPFQPRLIRSRVDNLLHASEGHAKIFTGAYMVRCDTMDEGEDKTDYLINAVFQPLWDERKRIQGAIRGGWLCDIHKVLCGYYAMGSFMAAQVIADLKYSSPLLNSPDWHTWAAMGPGSSRGMNRVLGFPTQQSWGKEDWLVRLHELRVALEPMIKKANLPALHAQDLQNCLCEFDKYERVRLGEGKPRSKYEGAA